MQTSPAALPRDARERAIAEPAPLQLQRWLGRAPARRLDPDEQEFMMAMLKTWEDARTETQADAVLTVLRVRGVAVPEAARARILAERDLERLKRWHEKAILAGSVGEVIDDPS